jgi:tetratricopeptide (TPR) repeat protein
MNDLFLAGALLALAPGLRAAAPFDEGQQLLTEKRYPEAVAKLELAAHASPGSPQVLLNLGWAYWHDKRIDDAWRVGSTLVQLDPENRVFAVFLANTEIERKRYRAAEELANRALARAPDDHDASMVLARALLLDGKAAAGVAVLERILARSPDDHDASAVLARALYLGGREKEALAILDRIIARFPDDSGAVYRRAVYRSELGRKREALASLDALLAADPSNSSYRRSRAKVLSELGREDEAVDEWKSLTRRETDAQSLMNLGWVYWREKNYDAAWEVASTLLKLDDKNPAFLRFSANLEIERMNYPEGLRLAQTALSLAPGDRDAELTVAKALFRMQRVKEAMVILEKLIVQYPDNTAVQYRWAEFLGRTGRGDEALPFLDRLIKADPANETYRLDRAGVLYDKGDFDGAVAGWTALASQKTPNMAAVRRLRDDAFSRKDWVAAVAWQEKVIADNPSDPMGWEKLSKMYGARKQWAKALWAAERAISADPVSINGYYLKSESLEQLKNWPAAQAAYEDVVRSNPNSLRAYDGLSFMLDAQGRYRGALKNIDRIEALTAPYASPYLEIHRASLLANLSRFSKAHALLKRLEEDPRTPIPVLLYHGLSPYDRSDSIPQANLRSQMAALKKKGYQTMTVSELDRVFQGKARLPAKPILITFDDGRTDTFENADPVLREMGFRATMFVHVSKLRKPYFHASPEDIQKWQATGRWEMQAHGFEAHDPMPIDGFGRKGHFLPNRMWLAGEGRLETQAEYRARIGGEYQKAKQGVEAIVPGQQVVAFAYPYGDYGQSDYSNTPEAATVNRALVKKSFRMAFVQGQYGVNTLASNPLDLERFEVTRDMTADQLMTHLVLSDPRVQAELLEAQMWVQADQVGQAQALYADLAAQGVDEARVWADQGVAFQKGGDISYARNLFSRAAAQETDAEGPGGEEDRKLLAQAAHAAEPTVSAEVQEFTDSDTNVITKEIARGAAVIKSLRLGAWVGHGDYSDRINPAAVLPHIREEEGGLQLDLFPLRTLELDGFYVRRVFMDGASGFADNYSVAAAYQLVPALKLTLRDGMGNVETSDAIEHGVRFHSDGAGVVWDPALTWKANADYDQERYNDANLERDLRLRLTKRFSERLAFGVAYFNGDSTQNREPIYYTPRALNQYTGVLTLNQVVGEINPRTGLAPAEGQLQYEGGYGFQTAGSSFVNSVKATLTLRPFDRVALTLDGSYAQSPLYISRTADAAIKVSF